MGKWGKTVPGIRSVICRYKIDRRAIKNSIRNREARKFICMTHGHELMRVNAGGRECWWEGTAKQKGIKRRKKWDNYNSIINKIHFKERKIKELY